MLCQTAVLWSALIGASPFVCLIAASAERARDLLENIKIWLETNPLLADDFPEVTYPIQCLERITNRQKGQKHKGEPTRIDWASDRIVLPTIAGSKASGVVISSSGMKGSDIRGQNYARADGQVVRPQLVLVDDPQTTESAWSPSQSQRREAILAGDVLGMAGPGRKIAGLMACTVIRPADMADNILDREKHPEWQGERTKMVYAFPSNEKLWAKYAEVRADSLRNDGDGSEATEFYRANQEAMDAGAIVAWPQRYNEDELSAIQHAMNLRYRDEAAFFAEYQNEPIVEEIGEEMLTAEQIAGKLNGYRAGEIPLGCNHLTMFIDVQQKVLFWMLCGWEENFTGYIVDYGTWPDQRRAYFTLRDLRATISRGGLKAKFKRSGEAVLPRPGVCRRRSRDEDRPVPDRRQLGAKHRRCLPVLPAERVRRHPAAQPRQVRRGVQHPLQRVQAQARGPCRSALAHPEHHRQAPGAARPDRHQLLEELRPRPHGRRHGRPGLPVPERPRREGPPAAGRSPDVRVPREVAGPGPDRG